MDPIIEFKRKFDKKIKDLLTNKRDDNSFFFKREDGECLIQTIKAVKKKRKKDKSDYRKLSRFDVLEIGGAEKLIQPVSKTSDVVKYYVFSEDLFSVLHDSHISIGHGGRNRMEQELKKKFCNVTREAIMIYLSLCKTCNDRKATKKKGLVSEPILSHIAPPNTTDVEAKIVCKTSVTRTPSPEPTNSVPPMPEEARTHHHRDVACRLCDKAASPKKRFLFKEWRDKKVNSLIESVIGIKMFYHEGLSNAICEPCYERLSSFDGFVKCVLANQVLFSQNVQEVVYEVIPITRLKPQLSAHAKPGRKSKHDLDIIETYIETLQAAKKQEKPKPKPQPGTIRVVPPEKLQSSGLKARGISMRKPEYFLNTPPPKPAPPKSIEKVFVKEEREEDTKPVVAGNCEDGIFPDSPSPVKSGPSQPSNKNAWLEISSVRSFSNQGSESSQGRSEKDHVNTGNSSDSDCMIIDDEGPAKKRSKPSGSQMKAITAGPEKQPESTALVALPCRLDMDILVKEEAVDDLDSQEGAELFPDRITPDLPVPIKEEVDLENGDAAIAPALTSAVAEKEGTEVDEPEEESEMDADSIPNEADESFLPCFRCKKENESYLNLLYHHMNHCSPEVPDDDPDPPLALTPGALKKQCKRINTDEATLLRKIHLEISECMKNFNTLRDYYRRMINLTQPVLLSYCQKYGINLDEEPKKVKRIAAPAKKNSHKNIGHTCFVSDPDILRSSDDDRVKNCEICSKNKNGNKTKKS